jgi:hypothetical protein
MRDQGNRPGHSWVRRPGPNATVEAAECQQEPAMEYLVAMTTHIPDGTPDRAVDDVNQTPGGPHPVLKAGLDSRGGAAGPTAQLTRLRPV